MSSNIKKAPLAYDGTLNEFYDDWAKYVLLSPSAVQEFHKRFCTYMETEDPLFLIRQVVGQERGQTLRTDKGARLRPTDNAPAWWIHYQIFSGQFQRYNSFAEFIESIPCHMFHVRLPESINSAGWHVAHIFDVKDRDVEFHQWRRDELIRRTARNIHPCNYFYIPKYEWQRYGGDPKVITFFYHKFRSIYRTIWEDFLRLVGGTPHPNPIPVETSEYKYSFSGSQTVRGKPKTQDSSSMELHGCAVTYSHSRLCFKADVIEPLGMEHRFCIVTDDGIFEMTKREFYETFPKVLESKSYRQDRVYHYPKPPKRALQFKR
jgi:hypothetical protein